jgi:hypothetical protein
VHLYGVSYQRGETKKDAENLRQKICDRINLDLEPGPFPFAGRSLIATKDDGLLRLGRAALAIVSHLPRGPFVQAIATGCVAEAIMGEPAKYDLFKWVMSTAPQSIWAEVKQEVKQLLETNHLITKQAAYRLLSFEGSENAHELQKTFPTNLFPASWVRKAYKKDPCTSIFAWSQDVSENCLRRDDLPPHYIAKRLMPSCLNPSLSTPDNLGTRLKSLVEDIDLQSVWSSIHPTGYDLAFDEYEPSLCAYAPHAIADLVRCIIRQADQREQLSLRQIAWRIKEHYLIFGEEETKSIYRAWKRLHEDILVWSRTEKDAEKIIFGPVLKGLDAREQFEHLLERPEEAKDLVNYKLSFLPTTDWDVIWDKLNAPQNVKRIQRSLWFLSAHPQAIPRDCVFEKLAPFLNHEDSLVRSFVLEIAYFTQDEKIIKAFLKDEWAWSESFNDRENHWGSLLLCKHGNALTYSELRNRVHPTYLGYAVKCRGMKDNELNQYAKDIHHLWSTIGTEAPDLPVDFPATYMEANEDVTKRTHLRLFSTLHPRSVVFFARDFMWGGVNEEDPMNMFQSWESREEEYKDLRQIAEQVIKEQRRAGNLWFARRFHGEALDQILDKRPGLVSEWVKLALKDTNDAIRRIRIAQSFYHALCATLLKHKPTKGVCLYWRLHNIDGGIIVQDVHSKIELLDYALFDAPAVDTTLDSWKRKLEQCTTDQELMQVAIIAQHGNGQEWLQSYIEQRIRSSIPLKKSRAFTLLGFLEAEEGFKHISNLLETEPETWTKELLSISLKRWQINAWAKHWFRRFLNVSDNVMAWASFRLFLHCVDSRFWLWQQVIPYEVESSDGQLKKRLEFLADNLGTIESRIKKNEEPLRKRLFGQKIKSNQVWPWM